MSPWKWYRYMVHVYIRSNIKIENENKERSISYECKECNFVRHLCDIHNFNLVLRCLTCIIENAVWKWIKHWFYVNKTEAILAFKIRNDLVKISRRVHGTPLLIMKAISCLNEKSIIQELNILKLHENMLK